MRILVTGGAGFIGSALVRHALGPNCKDYEILNIDKLTYAGHLESLAGVSHLPNYTFAKVDICNAKKVTQIVGNYAPDAVMHLAAESHVDRSIDGPRVFLETNIIGTYNMLQASLTYYRGLSVAKQKDFRFLHISTDEVYGALGQKGAFSEKSPYQPNSPYSASKASADHLVRAWHHTYGLPVLTTNCGNNYGPFQFPEKLIPLTILKALRGEDIPVYGKGENIRDWIYVDDHVRALLLVLEKGTVGESYNIGVQGEQKNIEIVKQICKILDRLRPQSQTYVKQITYVDDRPGHDFRYAIDNRKVLSELDFKAEEDFSSGLEKTVQWYLDHQETWCKSILNEPDVISPRQEGAA